MTATAFTQAAPVLCVLTSTQPVPSTCNLGFALVARFEGYALLRREGAGVHLRVPSPIEAVTADANPCGAYFYLKGVDQFAEGCRRGASSLWRSI